MEIQKQTNGEQLEIKIQGRLDAYWSDHLSNSIEESIRQGSHQIQLNLAHVDYLSSAGIRVLLKYYKQLNAIKGSLRVIQPSEGARSILVMAGLAEVLIKETGAPVVQRTAVAGPQRVEKESAVFYIHDTSPGAAVRCVIIGDPKLLEGGVTDCGSVAFPGDTFGIGLGAFGSSFADCKDRFGEFLALAGTAAYLPTDGTNVPDYMVSEGALVPEMKVLYALCGSGQFAKLLRFDAKPEPPGIVTLAELVEAALEFAGSDVVAFAMIAESAGLVGASLRKSPAGNTSGESPLSFPGVRDWLSFTGERAFDRTLCLVVGCASRNESTKLAPLLRPIGAGTSARGHFHAAVFPYHPLQRGELDLHTAVNGLFTTEPMQGILHLLPDDRDMTGVGQSEFLRGALWIGPVSEVSTKA